MRLFFNLEEKNSNWLPLISKKAFPSLPFLSSCLSAEVFLPRDCVADTVERYSAYSHPFSLLHHSPQGLGEVRLMFPVSLIRKWPCYRILTNETNGKVCQEVLQKERREVCEETSFTAHPFLYRCGAWRHSNHL